MRPVRAYVRRALDDGTIEEHDARLVGNAVVAEDLPLPPSGRHAVGLEFVVEWADGDRTCFPKRPRQDSNLRPSD